MTLYSDYTQIGNDKYYNRDLEARQALNNLGALAAKNQAALATDVSGVLPIANGGTGASTIANARAALELSKTGGRTEFYVSTSGNDTTGDGSSNNPYRTIAKAVTECPYTTYNTIRIAPGTYNESVYVSRKIIDFQVASDGEVIIDGGATGAFSAMYNSFCWIGKNIHLKNNSTSSTISAAMGSHIRFDNGSGTIKITNTHTGVGSVIGATVGATIEDGVGATNPVIINSSANGINTNGTCIISMEYFSGSVAGTLISLHPGFAFLSGQSKSHITYTTLKACTRGGTLFE